MFTGPTHDGYWKRWRLTNRVRPTPPLYPHYSLHSAPSKGWRSLCCNLYYSLTTTTLYFELEIYHTTRLAQYYWSLEYPLYNFYDSPQWGLLVNCECGLLPKLSVGVCLSVSRLECTLTLIGITVSYCTTLQVHFGACRIWLLLCLSKLSPNLWAMTNLIYLDALEFFLLVMHTYHPQYTDRVCCELLSTCTSFLGYIAFERH